MIIFPLAPDQTIAQMWSNGARGGTANSNPNASPSAAAQPNVVIWGKVGRINKKLKSS